MAASTSIPQGTVLSGKYRVGRELGRGGMAAVYEAENVDIGKRVAIKVLAGHLVTSRTVVERFLREARAVAAIRSPHICDVFDAASLEDGSPYLVLELLEGESLYDKLYRERQLPVETTLAIILQVCRGLAKAHTAQIVHRDLKPENIFLVHDEDGHMLVKILDFGLAKFYEPVETAKGKKAARLTRDGAVFGTPVYMSPEQVRGQAAADARADLWALGCITYECFTGTTVWSTDEGVAMTFAQIASAPIPDTRRYRPDLPDTFSAWFQRALNRDISKRFQTVQEFADGLVAAFGVNAPGAGTDAALVKRLAQRLSIAEAGGEPLSSSPFTSSPSMLIDEPPDPMPSLSKRTPTPAAPSASGAASRKSPASVYLAAALVGLAAAGLLVFWRLTAQPSATPLTLKRFAPALPSASVSAGPNSRYELDHPWLPRVREAQALIAAGEHDKASEQLKLVFDETKHAMVRNLMEQEKVARELAVAKGACLVTGLNRPRRYDLLEPSPKLVNAEAPTLALGPKGLVVAWTDDRGGHDRAYAAVLDDALRNTAPAVEITPEGQNIRNLDLVASEGRILATYAEASGSAPGVYVRWLGADAVIESAPLLVNKSETGTFVPATVARVAGGFFVSWAAQVEADSVDLFYRPVSAKLDFVSEPVRVTDFINHARSPGRVTSIGAATAKGRIAFAYALSREPVLQVRFQAVPEDTVAPGLPDAPPADRTLGTELVLSGTPGRATDPSVACNPDGCFVAWHGVRSGSAVAYVDAERSELKWTKELTGGHPRVAVGASGQAMLAWYDNGKVNIATIGRQGIGPPVRIANITGDHPAPMMVPGAVAGDWYVAWSDFEGGRLEPYVLRVRCK